MQVLLETIQSLMCVANGDGDWDSFLALLAQSTGATGANLFFSPTGSLPARFFGTTGLTDESVRTYAEHYVYLDPRATILNKLAHGQSMACHHWIDSREVSRSEFYQDFLLPLGLRYCMGSRLAGADGREVLLGIHRGPDGGRFTERTFGAVSRLAPVLNTALNVWEKQQRVMTALEAARSALDEFKMGILVVDARGNLRFANDVADRCYLAPGRLVLRLGCLHVEATADDQALQAAITRAARSGLPTGFRLGDREGASSMAFVTPIGRRQANILNTQSDGILVLLEQRDRPLGEQVVACLQAIYGLSVAEAEIAVALSEGAAPEEIAIERDVAVSTIRTQIRSIFTKMEIRRHAELGRIVRTLPAILLRDPVR